MKKRKTFILFIILSFVFAFSSCVYTFGDNTGTSGGTNDVTNKITNEITNKVVNVEEITITDINDALVTAIEKVEEAVIGVTLKQITTLNNGTTSEDSVQMGSGVIYKVEEIKNEEGTITNFKYYAITNRHVVLAVNPGNYQLYAYLWGVEIRVPLKC